MIVLLVALLVGILIALYMREWKPPSMERGRLCDFTAGGSVFEDVGDALARGIRLLELHVYSDEQGHPIVATRPQGDVATDNVTFESVCVALTNDAFPSSDPLIVSIVPHTEQADTFNEMTEILKTTLRHHLVEGRITPSDAIDSFANKVLVVSGGYGAGTSFDASINLNWNESNCRRLTQHQATHPRDPAELTQFNTDFISIVSAEPGARPPLDVPDTPLKYGCQWNVFLTTPGFTPKLF